MKENELETTQPNNQEEENPQAEPVEEAAPEQENAREPRSEEAATKVEGAESTPEAPLQKSPQASKPKEGQEQDPNWYKQFLDDYEPEIPKRGQVIEGYILRIDEDAVIIDVGLKRDAIVPSRDLSQLSSEFIEGLNVGEKVVVYVINPPIGDQDLLVSLSKGIEHESWENAEKYLEDETLLELEVVGYNKGGLLVSFENLRGFVPASQIPDLRRIGDRQRVQKIKQDLVGTTLGVKPIEVNRQRNRLVFSARAAQDEQRKKRLSELEKGQVFLQTRVASVVDFGVFVDLGGVDGLVHISELDWKMVKHPADLFKSGDKIDVQVIDVDVDRERISLSRKALLPNPWHTLEDRFKPGDVIEGRVTRLMDFGAFVEVTDGVEGLVHVSELGYSSAGKPEDVVAAGEMVLVRVLDIDIGRERLSLSMRRVPIEKQMAWMAEAYTEPGRSAEEAPAPVEEPSAAQEDATVEEEQLAEAEVEAGEEEPVEPAEAQAASGSEASVETEVESTEAEAEVESVEAEVESADTETESAEAEAENVEAETESVEVEVESAEAETESVEAEVESAEAETESIQAEESAEAEEDSEEETVVEAEAVEEAETAAEAEREEEESETADDQEEGTEEETAEEKDEA